MNIKRMLVLAGTLCFGLTITITMLMLLSSPQETARAASSWYVAPGGDDSNACDSTAAPCATINGAIGKATGGDTIFVATGTYNGSGNEVVLIDRDITLSGGWDDAFTTKGSTSTIDGEDLRRGIVINGSVTAAVENFTVQHGYADNDAGGGINNFGTLTLTNSTVSYNTSDFMGGGICASINTLTVIMDSRIYANHSLSYGGGIATYGDSHLSMSRSLVVGNAAPIVDGGGIFVGGSSYIENSIIAGNTAGGTSGGGFDLERGQHRIVNSNIVGNKSSGEGGAIATIYAAQVEVINTLIISNTGTTGFAQVFGNDTVFQLNYCDTYGNGPDSMDGVTVIRTNCLGTPPEDGLDPMMVGGTLPSGVGPDYADEWLNYDYRLLAVSPAIDKGTPVGAPASDIEGNPRGATPDIGAFENIYLHIYLPLASK